MSAGCFLYWRSLQSQPAADDNDQALAEMEQSRVYEQAVERNVGGFGLLMSQAADAVAKLGEPRPFAITVMVLANLTAGGCFLVATRLPVADRGEKTESA